MRIGCPRTSPSAHRAAGRSSSARRRGGVPSVLVGILCASACGGATEPALTLDPQASCADHSGSALVTFANPLVAWAVGYYSGAPADEWTCERMAAVEFLALGGGTLTPLDGVQNLRNLRWLEVEGGGITIADMERIAELPRLYRLRIVDNGLVDLSSLTSLELGDLSLERNSITDVRPLGQLPFLARLNLSDNPLAGLSGLGGLEYLRELRLERTGLTTIDGLLDLPELAELHLFSNDISDVAALSGLTKLSLLNAADNAIHEVPSLAEHSRLNVVLLSGNVLANLDWLDGNDSPYLETLDVSENELTDISGLGVHPRLTFLNLQDNEITEISALSSYTTLRHVDLSRNAIRDIGDLAGNALLSHLWLSDNAIADVGPLRNLTSLDVVDLSGNADLSDVQPLIDNPGITRVPTGDLYNPFRYDWVYLLGTRVPCDQAEALGARGAIVVADCD